ncbi:Wzz/FepE/Etk N-terminal domain-containing protein [Thioalkalivibrio sp. ALJ15]|uniref:Wzz/FepE/Etk N-terminal domain-containing protein n=1 Tax=Thioalkalivibrio sp. ALJ15 TaxID=748652 RepID=UPI0003744FD2|nr:Wzz/FepE/Etk N-terminal domain-containing protein [Thioalkalivibrio sp. ALJ15]
MPPNDDKSSPSASPRERDERLSGPYDDEISLVDLWKVLEQRKWWLFGIAFAVLLAGVVYALMQTPRYAFDTHITLPSDLEGKPLVDVATLREETELQLVGTAIAELVGEHDVRGLSATLERLGKMPVVKLSTLAPKERASSVEALHARVTDALYARAAERIAVTRQALEGEWMALQRQHQFRQATLDHKEQEFGLALDSAERQLERLAAREELLGEQLSEVQLLLDDLAGLGGDLSANARVEQQTTRSSLMERAHRLREEIEVSIPAAREALQQEAERKTMALQELPFARTLDRDWFEYARLQHEPVIERHANPEIGEIAVMSASPAEDRRGLIIALSVVLGLMLGVFVAFFREFLANVRAAENS